MEVSHLETIGRPCFYPFHPAAQPTNTRLWVVCLLIMKKLT